MFLKEIHPSELITFWSFMEWCWTIKNDRSPIFAVDQFWSLNNATRGDRVRPERTFLMKETGRKSNMNMFAIREETKIFWLVFSSLPPCYLRCHILRLDFDLEILNQAVPKKKVLLRKENASKSCRHFDHSGMNNTRRKCIEKRRES